jgi:hypothetical protein
VLEELPVGPARSTSGTISLVSGIDAAALIASDRSGGPAASDPTGESVVVEPEEPGWSWTTHLFSGRLVGDRFTVTAVDDTTALAAYEDSLPVPTDTGFATGEEKTAAQYARVHLSAYDCPGPRDGWRSVQWEESTPTRYLDAHLDTVTGWSPLPISGTVTIGLLAAAANSDIKTVRADLDALYPGATCVIPSDVTSTDIDQALKEPAFGTRVRVLRAEVNEYGMIQLTPTITVEAPAITPALADAVGRYPTGLVRIATWHDPLP